MSKRSVRNKLRFQLGKAAQDVDRALGHLKTMDEINDGRHPVINQYIPEITTLAELMRQIMVQFREKL